MSQFAIPLDSPEPQSSQLFMSVISALLRAILSDMEVEAAERTIVLDAKSASNRIINIRDILNISFM